jgi:RNA polymerase sigma factor (sigma-70 family)
MNMEKDELSDEFLIDAIAGRAMWAFERLHDRYDRGFYKLVYRMTSDHMTTEELVQDAFFSIWQSAKTYAPQAGSARRWLFSIIYHQTINYLRGVRSHSSVQLVPLHEVEAYELFALEDVWEQAWTTLQSEELRACMLQLPAEQRTVIELAYFGGWTHGEIAQHFNIPLGTVKARIHLGVQHLRQMLEQREREGPSSGQKLFARNTNRWQTRPRQAATVIVQIEESECAAGYELCQDGLCRCFKYTEWEHLVEQVEAFEFRGTAGSFTARKDRRTHGHFYWYAYTWGSTGRQKAYLGRPAELTLARLEAMAKKLHKDD